MKVAIQQLHANSYYAKILHWGKLISITGGTQLAVQGSSLLAGILIIRLLPTKEYAFYTLANTMLSTMTILADGGISNGVMAQGGKVWQDKDKLGTVLASGLALRKKFAIVSLLLCVPILSSLLLHNGATVLVTVLIILALVPTFLADLTDSLLEIIPKLQQEIKPLQKNQLIVSTGRLFLNALFLSLLPLTIIALITNGIARIYGNIKLMNITYRFASKDAAIDTRTQKEIIHTVKRVMPLTIYYCFSNQIVIWILSIVGNTSAIAQVGALSRLSMILNLFSMLVSTLLLPRFARISINDKTKVVRTFIFSQAAIILMCVCIVMLFYIFPQQFLWILGTPYANLSKELILIILSSCIGLLASTTGNLLGSRGWFINPLIIIGLNIACLLFSAYVFNISQVSGILNYNILLGVLSYIITISYGVRNLIRFSGTKMINSDI